MTEKLPLCAKSSYSFMMISKPFEGVRPASAPGLRTARGRKRARDQYCPFSKLPASGFLRVPVSFPLSDIGQQPYSCGRTPGGNWEYRVPRLRRTQWNRRAKLVVKIGRSRISGKAAAAHPPGATEVWTRSQKCKVNSPLDRNS